ncbi:hypothetical protein V5O48_012301 [Marasmius crinis-equi]|uniref:MOSC domain-containing protein n=1 Tax=Marasmius crinis-equi TaxID=585013 RepID=A0ABR3F3R6_9AGAR
MSFLPLEPTIYKWISYDKILEEETTTKLALACAGTLLMAWLLTSLVGFRSRKPGKGEGVSEKGQHENVDGSEENNFGYDVKVAKLLVHPIKFDRIWAVMEADSHLVITAREYPKMVLITPTVQEDEHAPYGGILNITFPEDSGCPSLLIPLRPDEDLLKTWQPNQDVDMFKTFTVDGYICQEVPGSRNGTHDPKMVSETFSTYFGRPVHLIYKGSTPRPCLPSTNYPKLDATAVYQDLYPLLFLSEEGMAEIDEETRSRVGTQKIEERWKTDKVVVERFRPNIVLRGGGAWVEDEWEEVTIGPDAQTAQNAPRILVLGKCRRCVLPNVSPDTGVKDEAVPLKVIMKFRLGVDPNYKYHACVGSWGAPLREGVVNVGDSIFVRKKLRNV